MVTVDSEALEEDSAREAAAAESTAESGASDSEVRGRADRRPLRLAASAAAAAAAAAAQTVPASSERGREPERTHSGS